MGNCIPVSPEVLRNETFVDLLDLLGNFTINEDYLTDYTASEPCHNTYCPFFQCAAPAFLASTCVAAALATGVLLVALAKCPHAWPRHRALVAQLVAATGLFAAVLPAVAAGIGQGWRLGAGACKLTQLLWHCSIFAQGLLVASGCCGSVWSRWDPRSQRLATSIWVWALLLAVPAALASGTVAAPEVSCIRRNVEVLSPAYLLHLASCLCIFLLLPAALLVATLVRRGQGAGWGLGAGASWLFFVLWLPYSVGLAVDFLLHAELLQRTCDIFERFDYALGLCEALGVLHCCLGPPVLLAAGLCRRKVGSAGGF
ncbi:atypical chemokine receptor 1 [Oxyura jamaicensis]|uniref:atypical chemokine receptor 1 n=1 Tax=Oxyura jamaicensis TaxID=8884 RepID=UPI0015A62A8D|nr:atypical chemokine receptor 1 [Oxyura jamaicensis]